MLDFDRQIEAAFLQTVDLVEKGNSLVEALIERVHEPDEAKLQRYIAASLEYLHNNPTRPQPGPIRFQGEDLREVSCSGGKSGVQELKPANGFQWDGNKHRWWSDATISDSWKLEFDLARTEERVFYQVTADFTKAYDYGVADILIDGELAVKHANFYAPHLAKTGPLDLGRLPLSEGKHEIEIRLLEHDQLAKPRNMVGLDWIELTAVPDQNSILIRQFAKKHDLDHQLLARLIESLESGHSAIPSAVNVLQRLAKPKTDVDRQLLQSNEEDERLRMDAHRMWQQDSVLFADFDKGLPADWFKTGYAFDLGCDRRNVFSPVNGPTRSSGSVHSGIGGPRFFGVIRSPTFTIEHEQIHYRLRGHDVTIRLIIDGFELNTFNELLFAGAKRELERSEDFVWLTQVQDLKNYLGHRAYIEIIDHGDGFVELDEIRFANTRPPADGGRLPLSLANKIDHNENESIVATRLLTTQLLQEADLGTRELVGWIIENELVDIFSKTQTDSRTSGSRPLKSGSVSAMASSETKNRSSADLFVELEAVRQKIQELNRQTPEPGITIAITEGTGEDEHVFIRGNHKTLGPVITRRFLSAISSRPLNPENGSGRLALAQKITAPNNPLTSRVIVNRLWHHLLGRGIVESVDNFGVLGSNPSHPELLDHLASTFQADGWSLKKMIRRIVLTRTYQMSSQPVAAAVKVDPRNELLHRARIKRLSGEAIRDSILQISGQLDPTMFGPSIPIHLTQFMQGRGRPTESGPVNGGRRRSVYISVKRNFLSPMMLAFDTPIPFNTIGRRNQSNVPSQALILMNDPFVIEQAGKWAERLLQKPETATDRIKRIYVETLGRPASGWELIRARGFLEQQAAELNVESKNILNEPEVWQHFCHVMFNLKEFIFVK